MGLNPLPCPVNVSIAVWPWGTYLGDEGIKHGVRMKISSWQRHDPNTMPPAAKGTGIYINSSLAKVEALKAGYDEAILLIAAGLRQRVHRREHLRRQATARIITPPRRAGALEGITQDSVMTIARDLGFEVPRSSNLLRSDLYIADEAFLSGTAAEVVPDPLGRRPRDRRARARSPARSRRPTSPPCAARSTATRTGSSYVDD